MYVYIYIYINIYNIYIYVYIYIYIYIYIIFILPKKFGNVLVLCINYKFIYLKRHFFLQIFCHFSRSYRKISPKKLQT